MLGEAKDQLRGCRVPGGAPGGNAAGMCGRFALYTPPARIARYFGATMPEDTEAGYEPSWNVAPTDQVLGIRDRPPRPGPAETGGEPPDGRPGQPEQPERLLMSFRWGLVPWWSKDPKSGSRLFNARSETVATKASFREAFRERRIIVPADGFYEWRKTKTGARQPHYFTRVDGAPMAFAGLAERWRPKGAPKGTPYLRSCTVITAPGGADMDGIHDRMPVILDPATFDLWLDPNNEDGEGLRALLRPPPAGTVAHHPVGPRIGNVRNNDPTLIESV
jgi:putative SOS response-associated peptidase YedK